MEDLAKNASMPHTRYFHRRRFLTQNPGSLLPQGDAGLPNPSGCFFDAVTIINLIVIYTASLFQGIGISNFAIPHF